MKKLAGLGMLLALCGTVGCDESMTDHKADAVREQSQADAERVRAGHDQAADNVRNQTGKDALGNARTDSAENQADTIEKSGEIKADAIERSGENKADQIEATDNDNNTNVPPTNP